MPRHSFPLLGLRQKTPCATMSLCALEGARRHIVRKGAVDYLMDPVSGNNAKNRQVHGALSLHVDDLLMTGDDVFEKEIMGRLRQDFQLGSEDKNDCLFVGQRIQWKHGDKHGWHINVHQNVAIDELQEISFDKHLKDDTPLTPQMHTACRSVLGQINWLQSTLVINSPGVHPRHHHQPLRTFTPSTRQSEPSNTFRLV